MIKGIPKHNYQPPHNSIKLQRASTDTCQPIPVHRQWMHMNWYLLGSRQVSLLAASLMNLTLKL